MHNVAATVEYAETGTGPTLVLVPGGLSTSAVWKPIMQALADRFRIVTTTLLGNGGTAERRSPGNTSVDLQADALELVVRRAGGGPVHLVAHSYGGVGALAVAMRRQVPLSGLFLIEPNPADVLRQSGEPALYARFRTMSDAYLAAYAAGEREAVARMVDFYGGPGSYAALPQRSRDYLVAHTASNMLDWEAMYGFDAPLSAYAAISAPTVIVRGMRGNPAMQRIAEILSGTIPKAELVSIEDASHFMLATHPDRLARLIAAHALYG